MAEKPITITTLGPELAREVRALVQRERARNANPRRKRIPQSSSSGCDSQNAIWQITVFGKPTGGTLSLIITINGVTATVVFNWNDSAATIKSTLIAGHSEITSSNIAVTGSFPNSTVSLSFTGNLAGMDIALPDGIWGALTGGTGTGIIASMAQKGHS